jgi:FMN phosphatase YigB (HAD superfamily)
MYESALSLLDIPAERVAMVAAHAYDCAAARRVGFKTVYIYRSTEDRDLDMEEVKESVDVFIPEGGLQALADYLGC